MKKIILLATTFTLVIGSCKQQNNQVKTASGGDEMAVQKTMETATRNYLKAWNDNDFELAKSLITGDFKRTANGQVPSDSQAVKDEIQSVHTAVPDYSLAIHEITIKGNKSYSSWTSGGTNTGDFGDFPPTGKKYSAAGFTVLTFNESGKAIMDESYVDMLGVIQGWGYTVTPPIME